MASINAVYSDTARALASHIDDEDDIPASMRQSTDAPSWRRRSGSRNPTDTRPRWQQTASSLQTRFLRLWDNLTPLQKGGIVILNIMLFVLLVLGLVYNERIFAALAPAAKRWRDLPGGWVILWLMTFFVSFPPLIGYSTCVTIAGFVFGMKGWFIIASATVLGSTLSFIVSRTLLKGFVGRLTEKNAQFAALSLVLKHDGLKLLILIRACPLPYSLSNGAISTIPTVTWQNFAIATAVASPKLLLHIFVGSRLGDIAENGDKMDWRTKMVSYISIVVGIVLGAGVGYFIWTRTAARAKALEAEEAAAAQEGQTGDYADDPVERAAVGALRRGADDVSLHTTYEDDLEGGRGGGYVDDFTDEEDARERDPFGDGDGFESEDESTREGRR